MIDVRLAQAIVLEAGPKTSTFLDVFRAYSKVLLDHGFDPADDVE
jgi:hypothetical protein